MTEAQARVSGKNVLIGKMMMARIGRARERSETQGFMKVLVDADTKRILGANILGIGGDEVVHSLLDVMYADAPYTVIPTGGAYPSDGEGVDSNHAGGSQTTRIGYSTLMVLALTGRTESSNDLQ